MLPALLLSLALFQTPAQEGREGTAILDPVREARVQALGKQLRCAVCQGVSIADSPASMARAQLDKVRELVVQEKTDDEIYDYFVERYGEWALMEPKKSGVTLGLWVFPLILLAGGVLFIVASARGKPAAPVAGAPPPVEEDAFTAQVRADLEKDP